MGYRRYHDRLGDPHRFGGKGFERGGGVEFEVDEPRFHRVGKPELEDAGTGVRRREQFQSGERLIRFGLVTEKGLTPAGENLIAKSWYATYARELRRLSNGG